METELTSLCQSVLEDFNLVLFYLPPPAQPPAHAGHSPSEEEEEPQLQHDSACALLPDALVFKMVVTCLMVVHSLKRGGQWQDYDSILVETRCFLSMVSKGSVS